MKTLYLVRHAKSSWEDASLRDFDRPLNKRGKHDAPMMGKIMRQQQVLPDLLLSSPAERAIRTAHKMAGEMGYPADAINTHPDLYHATPDTLLAVIKRLPADHHSVMLFGHNPGLTEFANMLASCDIDNIPTCGIVCVTFVTDTWKETAFSKGVFQFFDYPKKHK